jgi:hypothetical protein
VTQGSNAESFVVGGALLAFLAALIFASFKTSAFVREMKGHLNYGFQNYRPMSGPSLRAAGWIIASMCVMLAAGVSVIAVKAPDLLTKKQQQLGLDRDAGSWSANGGSIGLGILTSPQASQSERAEE